MKGFITAAGLALLLGMTGAARATTAIIDFSDPTKTSSDLIKVVDNADGKVTSTKQGTFNAVQTSGTAGTTGYLYLAVKRGLFDKSKSVWARVDYFDQGTDTFQLEYDTESDPNNQAIPTRQKFDTRTWTTQVYKLLDFSLKGRETGGADVRINDNGDGPEIISRVTLTDVDPETTHFTKNDPAHPIKIDGVKSPGEWDGAASVTVDRAEFDVFNGRDWAGPEEFSGTYSFKWDETGLYILGEVTDSTPRLNDSPPPNYFAGDGIEVFLGLDWSDPNHVSYNTDTDFQVSNSLGDKAKGGPGPSRSLFQSGSAVNDLGPIPSNELAIVYTPKGYLFEMLIPWSELNPNFKPMEGQQIGWDMFANNSKELPSSQQVPMTPFRRPGPSGNPSRWATGVLEPFKAQPVANPAGNPPTAGQ